MLNAMLPLKITGTYGLDDLNRCTLLLQSLMVHITPGTIDHFDIVAPDPEIAEIKSALEAYTAPLRIRYIPETNLIHCLGDRNLRVAGWRRQMLLKLAYCVQCPAEFVLILDADVVCSKNFSRVDLVRQRKALLQLQPIMSMPNFPEWYLCSMSILGFREALMGQGMSVTPALLSPQICRGLAKFLQERFHQEWWRYLISLETGFLSHLWPKKQRRNWTEYSLYFLYAQRTGMLWKYHATAGTLEMPAKLLSDHSVWYDEDERDWRPEWCFSELDPAIFFVYQSSTGATPEKVWSRIRRFIEK